MNIEKWLVSLLKVSIGTNIKEGPGVVEIYLQKI